MDVVNKPHAVCISFPVQSHMKGIMKLAKLLHSRGFYITFVNTEFNQNRLIKANGSDKTESLENFTFETIPDEMPPSNPDATQDLTLLCGSVRRNFLKPFHKIITKLNHRTISTSPPVTCIVADGFTPFAVTAGKELGIPVVVFCTLAACSFMGFYQNHAMLEKGFTPVKDESDSTNSHQDTIIDWIPAMKNIRSKDVPTFLEDPNCDISNLINESAQMAVEATGFGLHTFDALEPDVLEALESIFSHIYTIGPLELLLNQASVNDKLDSLGYNLWDEDSECLNWLESKERGSVLYVNFGSITEMSHQSLIEFAWGLANSNQYFLWIIRPDLVIGESAILPYEFSKQTEEKGFIASWCPQEQVLNHRSIGGFLTHCGWNSTIESLTAGVPMICWPSFGDQQTNCRFICNEWEVGSEIDSDVKKENVEELIRELMNGEKGKKMKDKAMEWKGLAAKAASADGSSSLNLNKLVKMLSTEQVYR